MSKKCECVCESLYFLYNVLYSFDMTGGRAWCFDHSSSHVVGAGSGLEKRQATLDLMFSGDLSED